MKPDWDIFYQLTKRHRVAGLAWEGVNRLKLELPDVVADELTANAHLTAINGLRHARECGRIIRSFNEANEGVLFVKGLALGAMAYPNPFIKMAVDIDLLVDPTRIEEASKVLLNLGYKLTCPENLSDLARWHRVSKESVWWHPEEQIQIDLHSRLSSNPLLLTGLSAASPSRSVEIASGIALPTLADEETFAYLCVHGASSAWFRLKWLVDLAAYLSSRDANEIDRLYSRAVDVGAGRAAAQALLLVHRFFNTDMSEVIISKIRADFQNRILEFVAIEQLHKNSEPTERLLGTATIHLSQLLMKNGIKFKMNEIFRIGQTAFIGSP